MKTLTTAPLVLAAIAFAACTGRPLKGGRATTTAPVQQTLRQSDNPSASSRQTQETIRTRTYSLPALSGVRLGTENFPSREVRPALENSKFENETPARAPAAVSYPVSLVTDQEIIRATTELGPAQKDSARELTAKLSSLRGIVWVGLGLFLFGLATIFYVPLRVIIGSVTTSIAITIGGVALMILPTLIVGNELLIMGGVAVIVGAWFLAHRHGHARGQLAARPATSTRHQSHNSP